VCFSPMSRLTARRTAQRRAVEIVTDARSLLGEKVTASAFGGSHDQAET
jgi:hypothetical protein